MHSTTIMHEHTGSTRSIPSARYAIVASRWNPRIVDALVAGAMKALREHGVADSTGRLFVSYYDADHGDLKLAIKGTDGTWTTQTVDSTGDVGLYTSIALDASGKPTIAYFQRARASGGTACAAAGSAHPDLITGVKLAKASSANPAHAADWSVAFVECAERPAPPCYGCTSGQVCVDDGNGGGVCAASATGCSGCSGSQICANSGSGPACAASYTNKPLLGLPAGVGLYPSVAFKDSNVVVAYYDGLNHRLRAATGTGALTPVTIDDGCVAGRSTCDDVGLFASVAVETTGQKRIAIAYHDATSRALKFFAGTALGPVTAGADSVIDSGLFDPTQDGPSFVGANVNLHVALDGTIWAAYQNSTANDLRLASHAASGWTVKQTWSQGALGWFPSVAQLSSSTKLYVSHTKLHTKLQQGRPVKDTAPRMEVVTP